MFNVTINDISVIYVTAHRCAGGLKKKFDLRSGSQRSRWDTEVHILALTPGPSRGKRARGLSRECAPPYPQRDRKRRLNGAVCRNHRIKRLVPCRC